MGNVAYNYEEYYTQSEVIGITPKVNRVCKAEKEAIRSKAKSRVIYSNIIAYGIVFFLCGIVYVNTVSEKTRMNIKLEKLQKEKNELRINVNSLKVKLDTNIDLNKVEKAAREKYNMKVSKDINYISLKK